MGQPTFSHSVSFFYADIADIQLDRTSKYFSSCSNRQNNIFSVLHLQRVLLDILPDRDAQVCSKERGGWERRPGVETMFFFAWKCFFSMWKLFHSWKESLKRPPEGQKAHTSYMV